MTLKDNPKWWELVLNRPPFSSPDYSHEAMERAMQAQYNVQNVYASMQHDPQYDLQQLAQQSTYAEPPQITPDYSKVAMDRLVERMSGVRGHWTLKDTDYFCTHVHGDTVFLFFIINDKEGIMKEHIDVFPSDTFITQLRLIT